MMELLLKIGPWLGMLAAIVFGLFKRQQGKTTKAEAKQEVAEVKQQAADKNAAAAQSGANAAQERINVENEIAGQPASDVEQRLRDDWTRQ